MQEMKEIVFKNDMNQMNWLRSDFEYGKVVCPKEFSCCVANRVEGEYVYTEVKITNTSGKPYFTNSETIKIAFPLQDRYEDSDTCIKRRCHAHIFCGGSVSYIMALRMGGEAPHLGMVLTEGKLAAYSIERDPAKSSNDRGCFYLHAAPMEFAAGETKRICWTVFAHQGKADFQKKLGILSRYVKVESEYYVLFPGEKSRILVTPSFAADRVTADGKELMYVNGSYEFTFEAKEIGEKCISVCADGVETWCRILVQECPDVLAGNRCRFIVEHQQYHGEIKALEGAYLAYDNEEKIMVYNGKGDYNGGRERVGMGLLISEYLQTMADMQQETPIRKQLEQSLLEYVEYVKRELADIRTGKVCNDMGMDDSFKRLYNAPWFALFFLELYNLYHDRNYLIWASRIIKRYYEEGGVDFYPIELPIVMLDNALKDAGLADEEEEVKKWFVRHADRIAERGCIYPKLEVNYEQSIVAPAASILLEVYCITGADKYLHAAEEQMRILDLFNGTQPDYHLHETAIRHWDGYWFGKRKLFGDTFPHYWSALTGNVFRLYAEVMQNEEYQKKAEDSLRGVLPMIFPDGTASCAYIYPYSVNGVKAGFYDPYANDQDWGLYFYLRANKGKNDHMRGDRNGDSQ